MKSKSREQKLSCMLDYIMIISVKSCMCGYRKDCKKQKTKTYLSADHNLFFKPVSLMSQ